MLYDTVEECDSVKFNNVADNNNSNLYNVIVKCTGTKYVPIYIEAVERGIEHPEGEGAFDNEVRKWANEKIPDACADYGVDSTYMDVYLTLAFGNNNDFYIKLSINADVNVH
jgi:hypothetical protein